MDGACSILLRLRVTSDQCPYCKADAPTFESFIKVARATACEVSSCAKVGGSKPSSRATELRNWG